MDKGRRRDGARRSPIKMLLYNLKIFLKNIKNFLQTCYFIDCFLPFNIARSATPAQNTLLLLKIKTESKAEESILNFNSFNHSYWLAYHFVGNKYLILDEIT